MHTVELHKGQIPLGPVPRNFLVASVTRKLPTSYRLVMRQSGMPPACYEEVSDFQTISACLSIVLSQFTR